MRVVGPGVGEVGAVEQRARGPAGAAPKAECAVDVHPRAFPVRDLADGAQRIDRAGVHVAGLRADDDRAVESCQRPLQGVWPHPPLLVGLDLLRAARAKAEHAQRGVNGDVCLRASDDVHLRRAGQSVLFDIPSHTTQHSVARGGEGGEVGLLPAGDQSHARVARQIEQLEQPSAHHVFHHRRCGRGDVDAAVLVPCAGHPVRRQRDREAAADDESEVARAGAGDQAALHASGQRVEDGGGIFAVIAERDVDAGQQRIARGRRSDVPRRKRAEKARGVFARAVEERFVYDHRPILWPKSAPRKAGSM